MVKIKRGKEKETTEKKKNKKNENVIENYTIAFFPLPYTEVFTINPKTNSTNISMT